MTKEVVKWVRCLNCGFAYYSEGYISAEGPNKCPICTSEEYETDTKKYDKFYFSKREMSNRYG